MEEIKKLMQLFKNQVHSIHLKPDTGLQIITKDNVVITIHGEASKVAIEGPLFKVADLARNLQSINFQTITNQVHNIQDVMFKHFMDEHDVGIYTENDNPLPTKKEITPFQQEIRALKDKIRGMRAEEKKAQRKRRRIEKAERVLNL
jgi:hypothetical protein